MTYLAQIPCISFKHLLSPGLQPSALLSPALPALGALPDARASLAYSFPTSFLLLRCVVRLQLWLSRSHFGRTPARCSVKASLRPSCLLWAS